MSNQQPVLLVVDDDPIIQAVITEVLDGLGYELVIAGSGEEAWDKLIAEPDRYDAVLLDRIMPGIDGMEVLRRIKLDPHLKLLPVILQTAASMPEQIAEGLNAGAFYYLSKPFKPEVLRAVTTNALRDRSERILEEHDFKDKLLALQYLEEACFSFRTIEQAREVATLLSSLCPSRMTAHMGLIELILNAIEHGNLGITYDEKTQLIAENQLRMEVERRLTLPQYLDKFVTVKFARTGRSLIFTIRDQGQGFDWHPFLEMGVDRIMDNHGRGIAMARRISFANLEYRGTGNCVLATIIV